MGVSPRFTLPKWREFPPPAALFERSDLPRIRLRPKAGFGGQERERWSEFAVRPIQPNFIPL